MNRQHPNFGLKTKISEKEWWRKLIRGELYLISSTRTLTHKFIIFYPIDL